MFAIISIVKKPNKHFEGNDSFTVDINTFKMKVKEVFQMNGIQCHKYVYKSLRLRFEYA